MGITIEAGKQCAHVRVDGGLHLAPEGGGNAVLVENTPFQQAGEPIESLAGFRKEAVTGQIHHETAVAEQAVPARAAQPQTAGDHLGIVLLQGIA